MWAFIIIIITIIVIMIIIKFIYDTAKQSSDVRSQGGIRKKYSTLIENFLQGHERCRILQDCNTFVAVGVYGPAGSQIYYIYPSYGNVTIRMEIKKNPLFGNTKMEWTFPENMSQEDMILNINKGIEEKLSAFYNNL